MRAMKDKEVKRLWDFDTPIGNFSQSWCLLENTLGLACEGTLGSIE